MLFLVSSPPRDLLLPVSSPRRYHSTYPCGNHIFSLFISHIFLVYITSPILVEIFFSLYRSSYPIPYHLLFVLITFILLVTIISAIFFVSSPLRDLLILFSLPRQYHFIYPCYNNLILVLISFSFSWFLCFFLLIFLARFSSS